MPRRPRFSDRLRKSRHRKKGFFKKGNQWDLERRDRGKCDNDSDIDMSPQEEIPSTSKDTEDSEPKTRHRISVDLHRLAQNPQTPNILPSRLRPKKSNETSEESGRPPDRLTGTIFTDVNKCGIHFSACVRKHLIDFPDCPGDTVFDPHSFSTWGLAISGKLKCSIDCGFISEKLKFYEEVEKVGRGRRGAKINMQLQVILSKQPIGNAAVGEILASIDTPCPSESGMQKNANKVNDAFHEIAKKQLSKNRELVKTVVGLRKNDDDEEGIPLVVAQSDVAYNNPVKGRSFYQPGTIAWAPLFVNEPGLEHIPIAFQSRSKVCSCPYNSEHSKEHKDGCMKNFSSEKAMGNAEFELGKDLAKELLEGESPIGIKTLVTDGDSHLYKGMKEVMATVGIKTEKGDCTRHITKSVSRNIRKAKLSNRCLGEDKTAAEKARNKQTLAAFIERRCSMEFRAASKKYGKDLGRLQDACNLATIGILGCIQGYPDICRQSSLVCGAHRWKSKHKPPPGLPNHNYVKLTTSDRSTLEKWIGNKLGSKAVRKQKDNVTTNRSEASHHTVLKGSPKCRNRLRNFTGRAKSAAHSMSMGVMNSVVSANSVLGADNLNDSPASRTRSSIRDRHAYQTNRKKSVPYKATRFAASRRARQLRQSKHMGYETGVQDPVARIDHPYT